MVSFIKNNFETIFHHWRFGGWWIFCDIDNLVLFLAASSLCMTQLVAATVNQGVLQPEIPGKESEFVWNIYYFNQNTNSHFWWIETILLENGLE